MSWLSNFNKHISDLDQHLNESFFDPKTFNDSDAGGLFYKEVVDKVAKAWDDYLEKERRFGFERVSISV